MVKGFWRITYFLVYGVLIQFASLRNDQFYTTIGMNHSTGSNQRVWIKEHSLDPEHHTWSPARGRQFSYLLALIAVSVQLRILLQMVNRPVWWANWEIVARRENWKNSPSQHMEKLFCHGCCTNGRIKDYEFSNTG